MTVTGVLFDVDGTLVDTTYLHAVAWSEALAQLGRPVATARAHRAIGAGSDVLLDELVGPDRPDGFDDEADLRHKTLYAQSFGHLRTLPGAVELLRWCHDRGLRTVLASSASEQELGELTALLDADEHLDAATSSDDAEQSKPHPSILHAALDRVGLAPEQCVMVGDAVWDGRAAARAGVVFVGLTCGGTSAAELREAGAVEVWADPADLLAHVDASALTG